MDLWHALCFLCHQEEGVDMKRSKQDGSFEKDVIRQSLDTMNMMTYLWLRDVRSGPTNNRDKGEKGASSYRS